MNAMGMPTPSEAWDSAEEAVEKLHEIDTALGGLGLAEATEQLQALGISLEVGADAAALTVSWWVGNAIGCTVTAVLGEQIVDAIDYLVQPITWAWIQAKANEVSYPIPLLDDIKVTEEEVSTRSSSTAQDDPPPDPTIDQGSAETD
jgi:hypothetical protein